MQTNKSLWRGLKASPQFIFQLVVFIAAATYICSLPPREEIKERGNPRILLDAEVISHATFGYRLLMADILWIRYVQEIDYKEGKSVSKGWAFRMLDSITTLDPKFHIAYDAGVTVLSVLIQDTEGGSILWRRAAEQFPSDWVLLYKAGYHFLYEAHDCKTAAEFLNRAAQNGAPQWLSALAGRLYSQAGQFDLARAVLMQAAENFKGSRYEERIRQRLDEVNEMQRRGGEAKGSAVKNLCEPVVK